MEGRDPRVEPIWSWLARTTPSSFLSWGWIACWLDMLPAERVPRLAVVRRDGRAVAAAFLGRRLQLRHGFVATRQLHLNATGIERFDELCIEHNGTIGMAAGALATLVELLPADWDELVLPGVHPNELAPGTRIDRTAVAPYVDLAKVRERGDYLSLLGSSTRAQLRRARKNCGSLRTERANSVGEALEIYDELVELHAASWRARGLAGAFADPWFDAFHRRLIRERHPAGEIELIRVRDRDRTLGCLYNLAWRGHIVFYQSGLAAPHDAHDKPGYLCHAEAIEAAAAAGHHSYDFLAGSADYKHRLATDETKLVWARIQRPRARFAFEDLLRRWSKAAGMSAAPTPAELA
ncbi:MAG TPA: GNAT family N-acetyltransferase [Kofleriaceae bacterium]|nr:GNAT family N-acetyltransferase [Kofleriaceae bacterium]